LDYVKIKTTTLWKTPLKKKTSHRLGENTHHTYLTKDLYPDYREVLQASTIKKKT
jgi:hypothetical protein